MKFLSRKLCSREYSLKGKISKFSLCKQTLNYQDSSAQILKCVLVHMYRIHSIDNLKIQFSTCYASSCYGQLTVVHQYGNHILLPPSSDFLNTIWLVILSRVEYYLATKVCHVALFNLFSNACHLSFVLCSKQVKVCNIQWI